jgi:hypothetical protein
LHLVPPTWDEVIERTGRMSRDRGIRLLPSDPRHPTFAARAEANAQAERASKLKPPPARPPWLTNDEYEALVEMRARLA